MRREDTLHFEGWSQESSVEGTVIKNVLLCGNESKNGYPIPPSAFGDESKVKSLYENKLVYINHVIDPDQARVLNRRVEDVGGYIKNVTFEKGKPRGDIHTEGCHKGEVVLKLASASVPNVGLSHVGMYAFNENQELGKYVESVEKIYSVDVVTNPATTKTFFEQTKEEKTEMSEALQQELKTVRDERNTFQAESTKMKTQVDSLKQEKTDLEKQVTDLTQENETLKKRNDELETEKALNDRKMLVESELKEADLDITDSTQVSKVFLESLQKEKDQAKRKELIADRVAMIKKVQESDGGTTGGRERQEPQSESWSASKTLESISMV